MGGLLGVQNSKAIAKRENIASPCEVFLTSFLVFLGILPLRACKFSLAPEVDLIFSLALF